MSFATRQMGNLSKPNLIITVGDDGVISIKAESTLKTTAVQFKLNEEFDETTADGRKARVGHSLVKVSYRTIQTPPRLPIFPFLSFISPSSPLRMENLCRNNPGRERLQPWRGRFKVENLRL